MNDKIIIKALSDFFVEMGKIYHSKWLKKSSDENKANFLKWYEDIKSEGISADAISNGLANVKKLGKFNIYPPTSEQFISLCKSLELGISGKERTEDLDADKQADAVYRKLKALYRGLWDRTQEDVDVSQYSVWMSTIRESGISAKGILSAYEQVNKLGQYRNYPPTINSFIDIAKIIESEKEIPFVENAYVIATSGSKDINPLIRIARQRFGYYELRTESGNKTKSRFEDVYRQVIIDFFDGTIDIESEVRHSEPEKTEISQSNKKELLDLLNSITNNKAA